MDSGWSVPMVTTVDVLAQEGMVEFYTGISKDSEIMEKVSSVTANIGQMSTSTYQLVFIGTQDTDNLSEIANTVKENIDWRKFVCVSPTHAAITTYEVPEPDQIDGTKGYVIFMMGERTEYMDTFTEIYNAVEDFAGGGIDILENTDTN